MYVSAFGGCTPASTRSRFMHHTRFPSCLLLRKQRPKDGTAGYRTSATETFVTVLDGSLKGAENALAKGHPHVARRIVRVVYMLTNDRPKAIWRRRQRDIRDLDIAVALAVGDTASDTGACEPKPNPIISHCHALQQARACGDADTVARHRGILRELVLDPARTSALTALEMRLLREAGVLSP